jgi:hypothetical protein
VYPSDILNIQLPIPEDLNLQREITENIINNRREIEALKTSSKNVVLEAKKKIELLILGN